MASRWIIGVAVLASAMAFIDATALTIAIPSIQTELGVSGPQVLWIQNAYALPLTALLLAGGALGDRYGRRRVFGWGVMGFAAASGLGGLATTPAQLLVARMIQGCGAALMLPGALGLIVSHVPGRLHGLAIARWSAFSALATVAGPVLGGLLTQAGWWRAVFWINLPIAGVALACLWLRVPADGRGREDLPLDWREALECSGALGLVSWGLIEAPRLGWTHGFVALTVLGGAFWLAAAGRRIWNTHTRGRAAGALGPLPWSRWAAAGVVTVLIYAPFHALQLFLPLNLIQVQGYRADLAGVAQLPLMVGLIGCSAWAGKWVDRRGPWAPLTVGTLVTACGFLALMWPGGRTFSRVYWVSWFPCLLLLGTGLSFCVTPLSAAVMKGVPGARAGVAAGLNSLLSRFSSLLAFGVLGPFVLMMFVQSLTFEVGPLDISQDEFAAIRSEAIQLGNARAPETLGVDQAAQVGLAIKRSFLSAFRALCLAGAVSAGLGFWMAWKKARRQPSE